ncbi:MAG: UDP-N-acetylmuramate--L-alanine ligase [Acidimicrobiales bacterium]
MDDPSADAGVDLSAVRHVHVTNVGGAGMSAVATLLVQMGHRVSGHEPAADTPFLGPLRALGVSITTGDAEPQLAPGVDVVVVSTATPSDHPDLIEARRRGVPVLHRSRALAAICEQREVVAVAGTHGKTTTSALLATVLVGAGTDPGWVVGAGVAGLGSSASWGGAGPLVVEADESDGTFLALGADAAIVTNVEPDHLEHWGGEAALRAAFVEFVAAVDGPTVLCLDDPGAAELVAVARRPLTYGTATSSAYRIDSVVPQGTGVAFDLVHEGRTVPVALPAAPGIHNARNAAAALALAHALGTPLEAGAAALGAFRGVARRFEVRGAADDVVLVDSYDHLPTEVSAALAAARAGAWRRVVCCFQPHRFSRTEALWRSFAGAFVDADVLVVTDIYPAGEAPRPGVTGKLVADAVLDAHPWQHVVWLPTLDDVVGYLASTLRPGDLCITLGAGDLTSVPDAVLTRLEGRSA